VLYQVRRRSTAANNRYCRITSPLGGYSASTDVTDYVTSTCHVTCVGNGSSTVSCSRQVAPVDHAFQQVPAPYDATAAGRGVCRLDPVQPQHLFPVCELCYRSQTVTSRRLPTVPAGAIILDDETVAVNPLCRPLDYPHVTSLHSQYHHLQNGCIGHHSTNQRLDVRAQKLNTFPADGAIYDNTNREYAEQFSPSTRRSLECRKSEQFSANTLGYCTTGQQSHSGEVLVNEGQRSRDGQHCVVTSNDQRLDHAAEHQRAPSCGQHDTPRQDFRSYMASPSAEERRPVSRAERLTTKHEEIDNYCYSLSKSTLQTDCKHISVNCFPANVIYASAGD